MYNTVYDDWAADYLDEMADNHNYQEEELAWIRYVEEREEQAKRFGVPLDIIKPTDTIWSIIQWIVKHGEIKRTIPLAGGRMTTKQEVVDCGKEGKFYLKTGWYTKDGVSAHTVTPDEFVLELVAKEVANGNVT